MPLQIIRQDITKMRVDVIVNTTNEEMVGYSGVDLAVHTTAGPGLDEECAKLAPLGLGQAVITGGYALPCKYVIHTSGPRWYGGLQGESILLRSCYVESLKLAVRQGCRSVAFPLISSGVYGYPKDQVLKFAIQTIAEFLRDHELTVYLCVFDRESYTFSRELFRDIIDFMMEEDAEEDDDEADGDWYIAEGIDGIRDLPQRSQTVVLREISSTPIKGESLREYLKHRDKSFREMLFEFIDSSGMSDVECYKRANVDKRTFSKIKSSKTYRPSKQTAIAFAISLRLSLDQTQELLATLGFTLSRSNTFDKIIRYFIHNGNYNIFEINEALFEFDQNLLGNL